jgi:hypothetical protein
VLHPSFPESEMGEVRDEMLAAIAALFDNPHELRTRTSPNLLFGEKNPDGWVLTAEDVSKITRAQLETFWQTFYRPNRASWPSRRRRLVAAARRDRQGVRRLGAAHGSAAPGWTIPKLEATRILLVDRPTRRRRRSCSATRGSSTPTRAGTRRR